jgi:hypothetical protein
LRTYRVQGVVPAISSHRVEENETIFTRDTRELGKLPDGLAGVYCFDTERKSICYVGQSKETRDRIRQHLERMDSSVTTDAATVSLSAELISGVRVWTSPEFETAVNRRAAEQVAFQVLNPTLRSLGGIGGEAKQLANSKAFKLKMEALFRGTPEYAFQFPSIKDLVTRVMNLEAQVSDLSRKIESL